MEVSGKGIKDGIKNAWDGVKSWIRENITGEQVGTGIGLAAGHSEVESDEISLSWRSRDINDPMLAGCSNTAHEQGHRESRYMGTDSDYCASTPVGCVPTERVFNRLLSLVW